MVLEECQDLYPVLTCYKRELAYSLIEEKVRCGRLGVSSFRLHDTARCMSALINHSDRIPDHDLVVCVYILWQTQSHPIQQQM